jgi:hypothetical protein
MLIFGQQIPWYKWKLEAVLSGDATASSFGTNSSHIFTQSPENVTVV